MLLSSHHGGGHMNRRNTVRAWVAALLLVSIGAHPISASADTATDFDYSIPAMYTLGKCGNSAQLDCVESAGIVLADDTYVPAEFQSYTTNPPTTDANGNKVISGRQTWAVAVNGSSQTFSISPNMETATHACCTFPDGTLKRFGAIRTLVDGVLPDQRVRFVLKTSWIKPLDVPMYASKASFKDQKIAGGHKWTFEGGSKTSYGFYPDPKIPMASRLDDPNARADYKVTDLYFIIDHAGATDELSAFAQDCSDKGYTAQASNASSAGMPFWDGTKLNFAIGAPHLTTDGTANDGFFQFWATLDYMKCKWPGNSLAQSSQFTVSVTDENGTQQIADTVAGVTDGVFHLSAYGFHYSSPTISVKAVNPQQSSSGTASPPPTTSQTSTLTPKNTFFCVKVSNPKVKRVVIAKKHTCPKGYKLAR